MIRAPTTPVSPVRRISGSKTVETPGRIARLIGHYEARSFRRLDDCLSLRHGSDCLGRLLGLPEETPAIRRAAHHDREWHQPATASAEPARRLARREAAGTAAQIRRASADDREGPAGA